MTLTFELQVKVNSMYKCRYSVPYLLKYFSYCQYLIHNGCDKTFQMDCTDLGLDLDLLPTARSVGLQTTDTRRLTVCRNHNV